MRFVSKFLIFLSLFLCGIAAGYVNSNPLIELERISLNTNQVSIVINSSANIIYHVYPDRYIIDKSDVTWSSSNEDVATVIDGRVKGVGVGEATITFSYQDYSLTCMVEVLPIEVQSITFECEYSTIHPEDTMQMNITSISPNNATFKDVVWESSNPLVATISSTGLVTGVSEGVTTIKAIAHNGVTETKEIEVKEVIDVESFSIASGANYNNLKMAQKFSINCSYYPANADIGAITFTSSNSEVVSVDSDGVATVHTHGSVTITAVTESGESDSINVNVPMVEPLYIEVVYSGSELSMAKLSVGDSIFLNVEITDKPGYTSTFKEEFEWISHNESCVTVSQDGRVNAISTGDSDSVSVTITVRLKGSSCVGVFHIIVMK